MGGGLAALGELLKGAGLGRRLARLDVTARRDLLALFSQSAGDWLDGWFESEPIKAAFGFDGIVGNYASPYTPGSAYVLLHHVFGEVNGKKGAWGHAIGGMGAITQAMARACGRQGRRDPHRRRRRRACSSKDGRVAGVVTEAGERFEARTVVSNLNPKLLFERLVDPAAPAGGLPRADRPLPLRLRHLPDERGAVGAAALHLPAGAGRPSDRRHHHRPDARLHGARLRRRARCRLVARADRRDADPLDAGRQPGPARPARRQPVLPARCADAARRPLAGTTIARRWRT